MKSKYAKVSILTGQVKVPCVVSNTTKICSGIADHFARKGAKRSENVSDDTVYKIRLPLSRMDPILFSKENFIGINPFIFFGRMLVALSHEGITVTPKRPRVHYVSLFMFGACLVASLWESDPVILGVGSAFALFFEALGFVAKILLKVEVIKIISAVLEEAGLP